MEKLIDSIQLSLLRIQQMDSFVPKQYCKATDKPVKEEE